MAFKTLQEFFTEAAALQDPGSASKQLVLLKNVARLMPNNLQLILATYKAKEEGDFRCYLVVAKDNTLVRFEGPFRVDMTNIKHIEDGQGYLKNIRMVDFDDPSLKTWKITRTGKLLRPHVAILDHLLSKKAAADAIDTLANHAATEEGVVTESRASIIETELDNQEEFMHFRFAMNRFPKRQDYKAYLVARPVKETGQYRCYMVVGDGHKLLMFRGPIHIAPVTVSKIEKQELPQLEIVDVTEPALRDDYGLRLSGRYDIKLGSKKPQEKSLPLSFKREIDKVFPKPTEAEAPEAE